MRSFSDDSAANAQQLPQYLRAHKRFIYQPPVRSRARKKTRRFFGWRRALWEVLVEHLGQVVDAIHVRPREVVRKGHLLVQSSRSHAAAAVRAAAGDRAITRRMRARSVLARQVLGPVNRPRRRQAQEEADVGRASTGHHFFGPRATFAGGLA